ncbi:hypothetical protein GCM10022255_017140 [Dactylosporangium darangshiense]|uniref:Helix-hairpin-helix domain-containing protein n=2 Tax=Dactylosporangium darangshiense TaxID=579108 RepID=A0ABP8D2I8_9ACTN
MVDPYRGSMRRLPWWFLIPLLTFGAGSGPMVVYGGARLRSRGHIAAGAVYGALFIVFFVGAQFTDDNSTGPLDAVISTAWLVSWLAGTVHTAILERIVKSGRRRQSHPVDPVLAAAQDRLARREQARALLASNPALAGELLIGRPDLYRQYDDGGLVDVNNVPSAVLAHELRLPAETAEQIADARERLGGFSSPDEILVYCAGITPAQLGNIRDRLVFLPR